MAMKKIKEVLISRKINNTGKLVGSLSGAITGYEQIYKSLKNSGLDVREISRREEDLNKIKSILDFLSSLDSETLSKLFEG